MKAKLRFLISTLVLFLAACGATLPTPNPDQQGFTQENASDLKALTLSSHDYFFAMLEQPTGIAPLATNGATLPGPVANIALQAGLDPQDTGECVVEGGETEDADGDEIPLSATFSFDCKETKEGYAATFKASIQVVDKDDTNPESGYRVEVKDFEYTETVNGAKSSVSLEQVFDLTVDDTSFTIRHILDLSASSPEESFSFAEDHTLTYTPDDLANTLAAGTFVLNGTTTLSAEGESYKLTVATQPSLHYTETCSSEFDGGSVRYADNVGNTVEISFNACDDITVTYNGSAL